MWPIKLIVNRILNQIVNQIMVEVLNQTDNQIVIYVKLSATPAAFFSLSDVGQCSVGVDHVTYCNILYDVPV